MENPEGNTRWEMSTKVWQVSRHAVLSIMTISLLVNMAGCSGGWITPDEINKSYDFSKLDQTILAYYEAINNDDVDLFLYIMDFPAGRFGERLEVGMAYRLKQHDAENQKVLKYRIDSIDKGEGFATINVSLQVKNYDQVFETAEFFDFTKINDEWKSKGFYGFPWSAAPASTQGQ